MGIVRELGLNNSRFYPLLIQYDNPKIEFRALEAEKTRHRSGCWGG